MQRLFAGLLFVILADSAGVAAAHPPGKTPAKAVAVFAPRPDYPSQARRDHLVGMGVAILEVDPSSGKVTHAYMSQSTGSSILDNNTVYTFRHWLFQPGTVTKVQIPINYTMRGEVITTVHVEAKPMDKMLAPFLGQGTIVNGPMPQYPRTVAWTENSGQGLYELRVSPIGDAVKAKVLKSSGDATFDQTTVTALENWRLSRGPMIIELPLSFRLTSTKYSVGIPKHP